MSIIIPVFNTVGTLETCFQSLVNQSWIDFNVIIVDDGSTDGSYEFCKSWEAKDNRFFVKKNNSEIHGPSKARNMGLDLVKTKFVTFIDSDDWVEPDHLQNLLDTIGSTEICSVNVIKSDTKVENSQVQAKTLSKSEYMVKVLGMKDVLGYLWNKMFTMSIINKFNLRLDENLNSSEDLLFVVKYLAHIKQGKVIFAPATYHYIVRSNSLTHKQEKSTKEIFAELHAVNEVQKVMVGTTQIEQNALKVHYAKTYLNMFFNVHEKTGNNYHKLSKILRYFMLRSLMRYLSSNEVTIKSKIQVVLVVLLPNLRDFLVKIKNGLRRS
ncbi:glycosyltransferase family 2 protein [Levilactobacillus brevis]